MFGCACVCCVCVCACVRAALIVPVPSRHIRGCRQNNLPLEKKSTCWVSECARVGVRVRVCGDVVFKFGIFQRLHFASFTYIHGLVLGHLLNASLIMHLLAVPFLSIPSHSPASAPASALTSVPIPSQIQGVPGRPAAGRRTPCRCRRTLLRTSTQVCTITQL